MPGFLILRAPTRGKLRIHAKVGHNGAGYQNSILKQDVGATSVDRWEMGVAHITGGFATCPEMVSPTAIRDTRVFNEMGEQCRRPER